MATTSERCACGNGGSLEGGLCWICRFERRGQDTAATCFRCGDDQNLIRDDAADTGAVCTWCLQHCEGLNEECGDDSATQALERGPR